MCSVFWCYVAIHAFQAKTKQAAAVKSAPTGAKAAKPGKPEEVKKSAAGEPKEGQAAKEEATAKKAPKMEAVRMQSAKDIGKQVDKRGGEAEETLGLEKTVKPEAKNLSAEAHDAALAGGAGGVLSRPPSVSGRKEGFPLRGDCCSMCIRFKQRSSPEGIFIHL